MLSTQKEKVNGSMYRIEIFQEKDDFYNLPIHAHPELELHYIINGSGNRIIGNSFDRCYAGEVYLLGSNLPHEWRINAVNVAGNDNPASSIVVQFNKSIFSREFYELKEANRIERLINDTGKGIKVSGKTRELIATKLEALVQRKGFEKVMGLLEILHILSVSDELDYLVPDGYRPIKPNKVTHRLDDVLSYIRANYHRDISLEDIARVAHLTPPAFCRLLKQKIRLSFVSFLNEVRITQACRLLAQTGYNISEIAFNCGYKTISNFNKIFKKSTGLSPKDYREKMNRVALA